MVDKGVSFQSEINFFRKKKKISFVTSFFLVSSLNGDSEIVYKQKKLHFFLEEKPFKELPVENVIARGSVNLSEKILGGIDFSNPNFPVTLVLENQNIKKECVLNLKNFSMIKIEKEKKEKRRSTKKYDTVDIENKEEDEDEEKITIEKILQTSEHIYPKIDLSQYDTVEDEEPEMTFSEETEKSFEETKTESMSILDQLKTLDDGPKEKKIFFSKENFDEVENELETVKREKDMLEEKYNALNFDLIKLEIQNRKESNTRSEKFVEFNEKFKDDLTRERKVHERKVFDLKKNFENEKRRLREQFEEEKALEIELLRKKFDSVLRREKEDYNENLNELHQDIVRKRQIDVLNLTSKLSKNFGAKNQKLIEEMRVNFKVEKVKLIESCENEKSEMVKRNKEIQRENNILNIEVETLKKNFEKLSEEREEEKLKFEKLKLTMKEIFKEKLSKLNRNLSEKLKVSELEKESKVIECRKLLEESNDKRAMEIEEKNNEIVKIYEENEEKKNVLLTKNVNLQNRIEELSSTISILQNELKRYEEEGESNMGRESKKFSLPGSSPKNSVERYVLDQSILLNFFAPEFTGNIPSCVKILKIFMERQGFGDNLLFSLEVMINKVDGQYLFYFLQVLVYLLTISVKTNQHSIFRKLVEKNRLVRNLPKRKRRKIFFFKESHSGDDFGLGVYTLVRNCYFFLVGQFYRSIFPNLEKILLNEEKINKKNAKEIVAVISEYFENFKKNRVHPRIIFNFLKTITEIIDMHIFSHFMKKSRDVLTVKYAIEMKIKISYLETYLWSKIGKFKYFKYTKQSCNILIVENKSFVTDKYLAREICPNLNKNQIKKILGLKKNYYYSKSGKKIKKRADKGDTFSSGDYVVRISEYFDGFDGENSIKKNLFDFNPNDKFLKCKKIESINERKHLFLKKIYNTNMKKALKKILLDYKMNKS